MKTIDKLNWAYRTLDDAQTQHAIISMWDKEAIWFSTEEQKHKLVILEMAMKRLKVYAGKQCVKLMMEVN